LILRWSGFFSVAYSPFSHFARIDIRVLKRQQIDRFEFSRRKLFVGSYQILSSKSSANRVPFWNINVTYELTLLVVFIRTSCCRCCRDKPFCGKYCAFRNTAAKPATCRKRSYSHSRPYTAAPKIGNKYYRNNKFYIV